MADRSAVGSFLETFVVRPGNPRPFTHESVEQVPRTRDTKVVQSRCPYGDAGRGESIHGSLHLDAPGASE